MHRNSLRILLAFALALAAGGWVCAAPGQDTERRLEQYHCVLRLPTPDFAWLAEGDIPGATLACRDTADRFVILIVAEAPPGYYIDRRAGAAFEKGLARNPDLQTLGGRLTEFLGVPCYEIRGRIKTDQSLTLTRMFAAHGFLYNLQAMIPPTSDDDPGKFNDLFATFEFISTTAGAGNGGPAGTAMTNQEFPHLPNSVVAPSALPASVQDAQTAPAVQAGANASRNPSGQAGVTEGGPKATQWRMSLKSPVVFLTAAGGLGLVLSFILLRSVHNRP